jgi:hypothetical protein
MDSGEVHVPSWNSSAIMAPSSSSASPRQNHRYVQDSSRQFLDARRHAPSHNLLSGDLPFCSVLARRWPSRMLRARCALAAAMCSSARAAHSPLGGGLHRWCLLTRRRPPPLVRAREATASTTAVCSVAASFLTSISGATLFRLWF